MVITSVLTQRTFLKLFLLLSNDLYVSPKASLLSCLSIFPKEHLGFITMIKVFIAFSFTDLKGRHDLGRSKMESSFYGGWVMPIHITYSLMFCVFKPKEIFRGM